MAGCGRAESHPEPLAPDAAGAEMSPGKTETRPEAGAESVVHKGLDSVGSRNRTEREEDGIRRKGRQTESKTGDGGERAAGTQRVPSPGHLSVVMSSVSAIT